MELKTRFGALLHNVVFIIMQKPCFIFYTKCGKTSSLKLNNQIVHQVNGPFVPSFKKKASIK
uniref:Putative ovule protein n=1 Tax=Solanum chacoense TaxID=4108 RepID=A0A0V0H636_SOLCH